MEAFNPKVDAYIAKAQPFAQPILEHVRKLVHKACPGIEEAIKWSRPVFVYKGVILANLSAFKEHCSFGFWGQEMGKLLKDSGVVRDGAMGSLGRITSVKDLPADKQMITWIRLAAQSIDSGDHVSPISARNSVVKAPKPSLEIHPQFTSALKKDKKAFAVFEAFSPSCKREYMEWIAEAKRDETRQKRIAIAVEWIAEGRKRNWKYEA
ncbi:YdeI/OmpD-associated family protein [Terracidiphilus gabretensis]|uniref:YdeI/OmpD-associated family protein n=1 Tax=Terracidiphilus gabretensis TaxID=1577687 RepID=UPI00071BFF6A|nr:YdeI/OmpD-associated family protein [Terracidiphilus gabretensis]